MKNIYLLLLILLCSFDVSLLVNQKMLRRLILNSQNLSCVIFIMQFIKK
ncbi:MAG: hypothetical protein PARBA_00854 [Parabacteroides sp.]